MTDTVKRTINSLVSELQSKMEINSIFLYGSYYKGNYNSESDIDLAFFFDDDCDLRVKLHEILVLCCRQPYDIQPQVFFISEKQQCIGIVEEIVNNGIEIYSEGTLRHEWMEL